MVSALYLMLTHRIVTFEPIESLWADSKEAHRSQELLNIGVSRKEETGNWAYLAFDFANLIKLNQRPRKFKLKLWFSPDSHIEPGDSLEVFLGGVDDATISFEELTAMRYPFSPPSPLGWQIKALPASSTGKPMQVEVEVESFPLVYNILLDQTYCFATEPYEWSGKLSFGIAAKEGSSSKTRCKIYSLTADPQYRPKMEGLVKLAKDSSTE